MSDSTADTILLSRQMERRLLLDRLLRSEHGQLHQLNGAIKELEQKVSQQELVLTGRKGASKMIENSRTLEKEIQTLRNECEELSAEVSKLTGDAVPLGETSIEFYESLRPTTSAPANLSSDSRNSRPSRHTPHRSAPPPPVPVVRRPAPPRPPSRDHRPLGVSEMASVMASLRVAPEGPQWSCQACTFLNHPALDRCEECEMPRIPVESHENITDQLAANPGNMQAPVVPSQSCVQLNPGLPTATVYWWPVYSQAGGHNGLRQGGFDRSVSADAQASFPLSNPSNRVD